MINLDKKSFLLSRSTVSERSPTFTFRLASLLRIFLSFVTHGLVIQIAQDFSPDELQYECKKSIHLSLPCIYKVIAIRIRIYGEQHQPMGVKKRERPMRQQLEHYRWKFKIAFQIWLLLEELVVSKSLRPTFFFIPDILSSSLTTSE